MFKNLMDLKILKCFGQCNTKLVLFVASLSMKLYYKKPNINIQLVKN